MFYGCHCQLNKLVLTPSNLYVCQQCLILTQLIVVIYVMLCWMLYFVWYKSFFLTVHSLWSLHVLNMFLSWILSYQDLHMIAFPGLIISILFLCRITYSILAHFYLVYSSLKSPTLISFQLCLHSSTSYLHRYSSYCGSVKIISTQVFFILR